MLDCPSLSSYAKNFGNRPVPTLLQQLLNFQQAVGGAGYSQAITLNYIQPEASYFGYYEGHLHQLITFGLCPGNGSLYRLWDNANNPDTAATSSSTPMSLTAHCLRVISAF